MDPEEVIMLTRSILASKKHAITLDELQREYFELNGTRLPFRDIGFNSLVAFLQNYPDKFCVIKTNNEISVKATIDSVMADLAKLVSGQKTNKKKKSKSKKKSAQTCQNNYNNNNYLRHNTANNYQNKHNHQNFSNHRYRSVFNTAVNHSQRERQQIDPKPVSKWDSVTSFSSDGTKSDSPRKLNKNDNIQAQRTSMPSSSKNSKKDIPIASSSPFIENASYFLKEANVVISHFETCETVYIRLIGEMFSVKYDKLNDKLNREYRINKIGLEKSEVDTFCVAYDQVKDSFHRVQIKKVLLNKAICFYLDEGRTGTFDMNRLFVLYDDYLETKFQAIKVEMLNFDQFKNNEYVLNFLSNEYTNKTFVARRYENHTPIKLTLYDSRNNCVNESILNDLQNFIPIQLSINQTFSATVSYIDEESAIAYIVFQDEFKEKFDSKMMTINKYFLEKSTFKQNQLQLNRNIDESQSVICFAKYVDSIWYRAKILRKKPKENTVLVHFIDFGNKEVIPIEDVRLIENNFSYLKYLPAQAIQVFILNQESRLEEIKDYMYEAELVTFRVDYVNNSGTATLDLVGLACRSSTSSNGGSSSSGTGDEQSDSDECTIQMSNINLDDSNEIVKIAYSDLRKDILRDRSLVYVTNQNHPTDFSLCTEYSLREYESFKKSMQEFYSQNEMKYAIKEPLVKDGIYVYKDDNNEYHRIKALMSLRGVRVFRIDTGNYDVTKTDAIFYITRHFLRLNPIVFRASLGHIKYDRVDNWSEQAKAYFKLQVGEKKLLQVTVLDKNDETETYQVDLFDRNESISKRLIEKGLALPN